MKKGLIIVIICFLSFFSGGNCSNKVIELSYVNKIFIEDNGLVTKKIVTTSNEIYILASTTEYQYSKEKEIQSYIYKLDKYTGDKLKEFKLEKGFIYNNLFLYKTNLYVVGMNYNSSIIHIIDKGNIQLISSKKHKLINYTNNYFDKGFLYIYSLEFDGIIKIIEINIKNIDEINNTYEIDEGDNNVIFIYTIRKNENTISMNYFSYDSNHKNKYRLINLKYNNKYQKEIELIAQNISFSVSEIKEIDDYLFISYTHHGYKSNSYASIIEFDKNFNKRKIWDLKEPNEKNLFYLNVNFKFDSFNNLLLLITKQYKHPHVKKYGYWNSFLIYNSFKKKENKIFDLGNYFNDIYRYIEIIGNNLLVIGISDLNINEKNIFKRLDKESKEVYNTNNSKFHINIFKINNYKNLFKEGK